MKITKTKLVQIIKEELSVFKKQKQLIKEALTDFTVPADQMDLIKDLIDDPQLLAKTKRTWPENFLMAVISVNPWAIKFIKRPSVKLQAYAVFKDSGTSNLQNIDTGAEEFKQMYLTMKAEEEESNEFKIQHMKDLAQWKKKHGKDGDTTVNG